MPVISVNLSDVQAFENLPLGEYYVEIRDVTLKETDKEGKYDQLMVTYVVLDEGESLGKTTTEWLSLSPKAGFRLKKWFAKFGLGDTGNLDINDDTNLLDEPDLAGYRCVIRVFKERDKRVSDESADDAYRIRTELLSVEEDAGGQESDPAPAEAAASPAAAAARRPVATAAKPPRRTLR